MNIEIGQIESITPLTKIPDKDKPDDNKVKLGIGTFIEGHVMTIASAKESKLINTAIVKKEFKALIDLIKDPETEFIMYDPNNSHDFKSVILHNPQLTKDSNIGNNSQRFLKDSVAKIHLDQTAVRKMLDTEKLTSYLGRLRDEVLTEDFKYSGPDFTDRFRQQMTKFGYIDRK